MFEERESAPGLRAVARSFRNGTARTATRIAVSLLIGLLLAGCAMAGAWLFAALFGRWTDRSGQTRFYVTDRGCAVALSLAAGAWLCCLSRLWWSVWRHRLPVGAVVGTIGLATITVPIAAVIHKLVPYSSDVLFSAWCLLAGALAILLWLPTLHGFRWGRSIVDAEGLVNVHCPECGYSLIGLRELRCPECGTKFTIDELIRKQNYGVATTTAAGTTGTTTAGTQSST